MSLSPVSAIGDMVAPVVLMTLATIFANGLMTVAANISDNVVALGRERMSLLRGPHGEMLDMESVPPADRGRLTQISVEVPLMIGRFQRVRSAILILWVAVALFVLSVAAIAAAVTVPSEGIAFVALALVIAGVAAVFSAIVFVIGSAARLGDIVIEVSRNMGMSGLGALVLGVRSSVAGQARCGLHGRPAVAVWTIPVSMHALRHYAANSGRSTSRRSPSTSATPTPHSRCASTRHLMPSAADAVLVAMDASLAGCVPDVPSLAASEQN